MGDYCLLGFKWGQANGFESTGVNAIGPHLAGGMVSFSYHEKQETVNNHNEIDVPTQPFDQLIVCAKDEIRRAFEDWSDSANIQFEELADDSQSDIKFFVAAIESGGNGFPNFMDAHCQQLAGHVILSSAYTMDCRVFYLYALHEIGHALGLGHSSRDNIMGASSRSTTLEGLQDGDKEGLRQIYGE